MKCLSTSSGVRPRCEPSPENPALNNFSKDVRSDPRVAARASLADSILLTFELHHLNVHIEFSTAAGDRTGQRRHRK